MRVNVRVFVLHVACHLSSVLVVELQDKEGNSVGSRAIDGFYQLATNGRQAEIHKVRMRGAQIVHQSRQANALHHLAYVCVCRVLQVVYYGQERGNVHARRATRIAHRLLAKSQLDAEAAHHLQHAIIIADNIAHGVRFVVFLSHLFYFRIYFSTICRIAGRLPHEMRNLTSRFSTPSRVLIHQMQLQSYERRGKVPNARGDFWARRVRNHQK